MWNSQMTSEGRWKKALKNILIDVIDSTASTRTPAGVGADTEPQS